MNELDRLLKSAAAATDETPIEMPFGFDTRVVARWRATGNGGVAGLVRLVRYVGLAAAMIVVLASAGVYFESNRSIDVSASDEFAIADSAIQDEFAQ
jgi:hypothetical protein